MKFMSFMRFFGKRWLRAKRRRERLTPRPARSLLTLEALEHRVMLSIAPPTIVSVTPADQLGPALTSPLPTIAVTFSEAMAGTNAVGATPGTGAANPLNYLLVDASGNQIAINSATLNPADTVVTLSYNGGNPLPTNTYTLFVRGNNLVDLANHIALAQLAQAFVANDGQNDVAVVNLDTDGTLGASSNYPLPAPTPLPAGGNKPAVWGVAHADLTGNGYQDLIIADDATDQLLIFAGRPTSQGGGFNLTPDLTLKLPTAVPALVAAGDLGDTIVVDDFTDFDPNLLPLVDVLPGIAVASADSNTITVFRNNRGLNSIGTLSFAVSATVNLAPLVTAGIINGTPTGIVAGDFNSDGFQDIAVVNGDAPAANSTPYFVTVFLNETTPGGTSRGYFSDTTAGVDFSPIQIGTQQGNNSKPPASGLLSPTGIALGDLNGDGRPDLAVGGTDGIGILYDTTVGSNVSFDWGVEPGQPPPNFLPGMTLFDTANNDTATSVAIGAFSTPGISGPAGPFDSGATKGFNDVVAALLPDDRIGILTNDGTGALTFTTTAPALPNALASFTVTADSQIALADLNGTGFNDVILTNANTSAAIPAPGDVGNVYVLDNTDGKAAGLAAFPTTGIASATESGTSVTITTTAPENFLPDQAVTISGVGVAGYDGTFLITVVDSTHFTYTATAPGLAASTGGTISTPYTTGGTPTGVDVLDSSDDGIPGIADINQPTILPPAELVTGNAVGNNFTLFLSNGDGTFALPVVAPINPNIETPLTAIAVGDLNGDGIPDIVVVNEAGTSQSTKVGVLLGENIGTASKPIYTYASPVYYPVSNAFDDVVSVAIGDLNNNGMPDIILASSEESEIEVLTNNIPTGSTTLTAGSFTFGTAIATATEIGTTVTVTTTAPENFVPGQTVSITGVSVAGYDGAFPITVVNASEFTYTASASALAPTTGGTASTPPIQVGTSPTEVITGKFTASGNVDVAVSHDSTAGSNVNRGVTLLLGNGNGTFEPASEVIPAEGANATALAAADFNKDGNLDLVVTDAVAAGDIRVLYGDGKGNFTLGGTFATGLDLVGSSNAHAALAIADVNNDGFPDIAVSSPSTSATQGGIAVLINQDGTGFGPPIHTNLLPGTPIQSIAFNDVNEDGLADLIVTTATGSPTPGFTADNAFLLVGNGNGTFGAPVPYLAGDNGVPIPIPSFLVVTPSPLLRVTTFVEGGNLIEGNLVSNGGFETADLSGETGNLDGWTTYREPNQNTGSHGQWDTQTGLASPLSGVAVPAPPQGNYQAMLDEADLVPIAPLLPGQAPPANPDSPNLPANYAGTNVLYQDITIPSATSEIDLSMTLYLDSASPFASNSSLDYQTTDANQQVRVDLLDPNSPILDTTTSANPNLAAGDVFPLFQTVSVDHQTELVTVNFSTNPLSPNYNQNFATLLKQIAGTMVRLRIAVANNQGKLIVGVDNVQMTAIYTDTSTPFFTTPTVEAHLRNPSYIANGIPYTTDPTIVGQVGDVGSVNNIAYVEFSPDNATFIGPAVYKILTIDPDGNFTFTVPSLTPGVYNLQFAIVSRASNPATEAPYEDQQTLTFGLQGSSVTQFEATGPADISVAGQPGVDYTSVSGRVTAIATDPSDTSGNTYYVGSANGGIWKTTDGGSSWLPLTDYLTNAAGTPIPTAIGALAVAPSDTQIIYAGTGVADLEADSRPGVGVLKSTDGGATWTLIGDSGTVLNGARISSMVVNTNNPNIVYAAVASGGATGPGVYESQDGGITWVNILVPAEMFLASPEPAGSTVASADPPGTLLASATDLVIDPFDAKHLLVGLGNMGLLPASVTAGVWTSDDGGNTWFQSLGGDNAAMIPNSTLPSGVTVGRVSLAISNTVRVASESVVYVLISNPPGINTAPNVDEGQVNQVGPSGLYKTSNNLLDFTKVELKQNIGTAAAPDFVNLGLGVEGSNAYGLVVDPADQNVVYVGGSLEFSDFAASQVVQHALLRVDTGNMRDAGYTIPAGDPGAGTIPNDGDDQTKALTAALDGGSYPAPASGAYTGEGVYWYDVAEAGGLAQTTPSTSPPLLPPDITALTFDTQGRLLIGTDGGIWRGENRGFGYDFGSDGTGIVVNSQTFSTAGMSVTAINGNLQITGLTSVAIDPVASGTLYTTEYGSGTAQSTSNLSWVSSDVTGPTIPGVPAGSNPGSLGIPNAEVVLAAPPPSNLAPGAPTTPTLYRMWQFAEAPGVGPAADQGVDPEKSTDGGLTWTIVNSGIPISNDPAGISPALALAPTLTLNNGQQFDQLLVGTEEVFLTRTNGNAWTQVSNFLTSTRSASATEFITALAFGAPPQALAPVNVFYAGTSTGEVFVTMNAGTDNWPTRDSGLPTNGAPVTQIAVDPNNSLEAFVTFGAGPPGTAAFNHVYETTNGGTSWKSVSTPSSGLPEVNANAVAIDPTPALDAPNGKVYVATDVGVYVTLNSGVSWFHLGGGAQNSLPQAPVVDLQVSQNVLAAAVQGRGVFTISTSEISPIADQVINANSSTPAIPFTINTTGVVAGSFSVSAISSNQAIIPNANLALTGSGSNYTLTVTAGNVNTFANGPVTITIVLTDKVSGKTFTGSFLVNVLDNLVINENSSVSFTIGVDDATFVSASSSSQTIVPNNDIVVGNPAGGERVITITPAINQAGPLFITLSYTNSDGVTTSTTTFAVLVQETVVVLPFADNFNRSFDPNFVGPAWTVLTGAIGVNSDDAALVETGGTPNNAAVAVLNGAVRADVSLDADVTLAVGDSGGLIARQSGAGDTNMYLAQLSETAAGFFAQIFLIQNGAEVMLASTNVTGFAGVGFTTTIRFDVVGSSLKMYVGTGANLVLAAFATDGTLQSGSIGLRGSPNTIFDNFVANNIPVASPTLSFTDTFATGGLANQLSTNWEDRSGNFTVTGGAAQGSPLTGSTTANLSILRGANDADVVVTAGVDVAIGDTAGLVARYSGSGDDTMYLGVLDNTTGTPMAEIMRSTGPGTWVTLNEAVAPSNSGTLRFVVIGDALQLFLGDTLMTFATDSVLTEGSVGIRGSATAFTDFTASPAPAAVTTLPFTDDFASTADVYGQPQANWLIRQGDIQVVGGAAVGQDPQTTDQSTNNSSHVNLAVLAGLNVADVDVSMAVAVNFGDQAGLVARYQDDNDFYLGVLDNTGPSPVASIWRNLGGVWTMLASAPPPDIQGTLDFTVVGSSLQLSLGGVVVVSATDTALTSGSVGVRTSATQFGDFNVAAVPSTLPFNDSFSSGTTLSPAWTVDEGGFAVGSGVATGQAGGANLATLPGVNAANVDLSVNVNLNTGDNAGLVARYSGPGDANLYLGVLDDTTGTPIAKIYLNMGGTYKLLGQAVASASSGTLEFQVIGSSLRLFLNGTLQVAVRDTNLTSGEVGIRSSATTFANFNAVVDPAVLPFTDSFSTAGTLSNSWLTEAGTFAVGGGTANGQSPINLATLPSVNATDVVVSASVNVGSGQQAGLIARHSALGDANYYLGEIVNNGSTAVAEIVLNVGGVPTTLATGSVTSTSGILQFEVDGTSLRLFLNNTLLVAATDSTLVSGSVGMRASVTSLGNFAASLYVPAAAALPFNDKFTAGNAQGQLASTWTTRVGDFTVAAGLATASSEPSNLAVLGGISVANVTVSATIALATGQQAALVAGYNGTSMYLGVIDNSTGTALAEIFRISATGQKTLLGQAEAPSGTGTLTFQVDGSALRLTLGSALLVDATDADPLPAGSVGISGSANVTFANFTANQITPVFNLQPTITSTEHTTFTENALGSFTVTTIGTPAPTLTETGTLPAGVTFLDNGNGTATLSGTPTTTGTYTFTITAKNGIGAVYTQNFTLTVALPLTVTTPTITPTTVLDEASTTFSFNGTVTDPNVPLQTPFLAIVNWGDGTYSEGSVSGIAIPFTNGSTFNYVFNGTHAYTQPGIYNVTVTITDAEGAIGTSASVPITVNLATASGAFTYDPTSQTLSLTGTDFTFSQATTDDVNGLHTTYSFTMDGVLQQFPASAISQVVVTGQGSAATAILITNNTYVDTNGVTQLPHETISLGSLTDDSVGSIQHYDANGNAFTFLSLSGFPISYAYAGRNDGAVTLFGTAGLAYNGFVSAGNYSYIGGPGEFHLAQGATSVYGYSSGQPTDFAYHYSANAGSTFVLSGTAYSYMSTTDTVNGVTLPYFNVGVGFAVNTGVSKHPGADFAYIFDSPANDTFIGGNAFSYLYATNAAGSYTEFDTAYAFALVYAESFVGGTDDAINTDPTKNILSGFHIV